MSDDGESAPFAEAALPRPFRKGMHMTVQENDSGQQALNLKQKVVIILMNVLLLAEMTYSIYLGKQVPEDMTVIFLKTYIPMVIGTLLFSRILIRRFGRGSALSQGETP
jgi:hypothetical protein